MSKFPLTLYTFLYHFSAEGGTEGTEHAQGTFINIPAAETRFPMSAIDNVTTHEFFHLWNVMRIRPCSMESVELVHQQYSPALWFSEGFTSAASRMVLLQAGYLSQRDLRNRIAEALRELQSTPANAWLSAEDASLSV